MSDQPKDAEAVREAAAADADAVTGSPAGRDGGPIDEDDMRAAEGLTASPETASAYGEALERGAAQQGEGRTP